ncbi:MAG TPA: 4a-hydroxytetrahydrobiopterin dehydratase [Microbacteriaceae bacterium]|nr:4a-hydroxytetrahydrobiopterin dehydratase [Microbacteriaceae bacterium]
MADRLEDEEIATRLADLPGWERPDGTNAIRTTVKLADFAAALRFVNAVGELAEAAQHHPDIDIRWNKVTLVLSTHSAGGLTQLDFDLARQIAEAARRSTA